MRLSHLAKAEATAGKIINILSNDLNRFDFGMIWLNYFWLMPLQVTIAAVLMWNLAGYSGIIGLGTMILLTVVFQGGCKSFSYFSSPLRVACSNFKSCFF